MKARCPQCGGSLGDEPREPAPAAHGLTGAQRDALIFIQTYVEETGGASPSYEEIRSGLDLKSKNGVYRLIHALGERGHLRFIPGRARSIQLAGASA